MSEKTTKQPARFLTAKHLADICDTDLKAVHNWAQKDEKIPYFTTPGGHLRFLPEAVVTFLEKYRYPVPPWVRGLAARSADDSAPVRPSVLARVRDNEHAQVGVAVLVRRADGALLLGLRKGSHGAGTWAPPGGRLEVGEEVADCAARELKEETGIHVAPREVKDLGIYTVDHFEERGGETWVTLWCAMDLMGVPEVMACEPEKCEAWRWANVAPGQLFACFDSFVRRDNPWTAGR